MKDMLAGLRGKIYIFKYKIFNKNIHIENDLKIYKKLRIRGQGKVNIGKNCVIGGVIGDKNQYVTLGVLRPDATIQIDANVSLYAVRISSKFGVNIGDNTLIEESGIADTDFHTIEKSRQTPVNENNARCQIIIGTRVSIGTRSFITKGVKIGDDTLILPGSVVTSSIQSDSIAQGNPVKIKKKG
ncbi:DapH/DapD/GlmU-related protein [Desulfococcaceae bacterium HSG9]|nr:DapH/DapD/GlmU-related protein [Desulfococcaceae bacterium HSG9]